MRFLKSAFFGVLLWSMSVFPAPAQDANSPLLQILLMGTGLHNNDWGTQTNANLTKVENAVAGFSSVASGGGGTVTLTNDQARYASFKITGALTSNSTIAFPATARTFNVQNATTGAYTVTINCGAGTTYAVGQGQAAKLFCDGSNIVSATPAASVDAVPIGSVFSFAGAAAPTNYALGDGSAVSRTTYATLFGILGTTYGSGDGSTTFNLPDCRGRVLAGPDGGTGRLNSWALGATGGASSHSVTTGEMPTHNHTATDSGHAHGVTDPGHTHVISNNATPTGSYSVLTPNSPNVSGTAGTASATTGLTVNSSTASISVGNTGSGTAMSLVQPTLVVSCIIRIQ